MPIKVLKTKVREVAEDLIELSAECRFTALGETSSSQTRIFSIDFSKIEKKLEKDPTASFSLQIILKQSVLDDIVKKSKEAKHVKRVR